MKSLFININFSADARRWRFQKNMCLGVFVVLSFIQVYNDKYMTLIFRLLFNALGLILIATYVPGIEVAGFYPALIAALILGFLNVIVRPILFVLTLPITILTLGLFAFIINGFLFLFAASFIEGFSVTNFWYALLGSFLMSIISTIGNRWVKKDK